MKHSLSRSIGVAALSGVLVSLISWAPSAQAATECDDFTILGARGTDQPFNQELQRVGAIAVDAVDKFRALAESVGKSVSVVGIDYPASGMPDGASGKKVYWESVDDGVLETLRQIRDIRTGPCGGETEIVLLGYSQGAEVMFLAAQSLTASDKSAVAGGMMFGDPDFDPDDTDANWGSFDADRAGLLRWHDDWNDALPGVPVFSACREYDGWCQGSFVARMPWGASFRVRDVATVAQNNPADNFWHEHEMYAESGNVDKVACELAEELAITSCDPPTASNAIDVAVLVDRSVARFEVVEALQARASEFISQVSHGASTTRYAVISYGRQGATDETGGFTASEADAVTAIEELQADTYNNGAIYSAINVANSLDWRPGARKVTLTLSTSRACNTQMCNSEVGTGTTFSLLDPGSDARRAGVYTNNNQWFFESAGWSQAIDNQFASRPGQSQAPDTYIDELARVFQDALTMQGIAGITGTNDTVVGEAVRFRASDVLPFYPDQTDRRLVWSITRVDDAGSRPHLGAGGNGGGPAVVASRISEVQPSTTEVEGPPSEDTADDSEGGADGPEVPDELPADMGETFTPTITESGLYEVTLDAYMDGTIYSFSREVSIWDYPTTAPAAPWLSSYVDGDEQVLRWMTETESDPESPQSDAALGFAITDRDGTIVDAVRSEPVAWAPDGTPVFEQRMPLAEDGAIYSVEAFNEIGRTASKALATADEASYTHVSTSAGTPTGGQLVLEGAADPLVDGLLDQAADEEGVASLSGDYTATMTTAQGEQFELDMNDIEGSMYTTDTDGWGLSLELRDATTTDGTSLSGLLDDGLAEELFVDGHIDVEVDGQPLRVVISPTAVAAQIDEFLIDSDSPAPAGVDASTAASQPDHTLELNVGSDASSLTFIAESGTPLQDWSGAEITDIRTWIGDAEVTNSLNPAGLWATGDTSVESAGVSFLGDVAGATPHLMRDFLQNGTIAFTVNGGEPTVLKARETASDAAAMFVDWVSPAVVGRSTLHLDQYQEWSGWAPVVNWGSSSEYDRQLSIEGDLPRGVTWSPWDGMLSGTPETSGTYTFVVTATSDVGEASKAYSLVVAAASGSPGMVVGSSSTWDNGDETHTFRIEAGGYFRVDNPVFSQSLPLTADFAASNYNLEGAVTDVTVRDSAGQPMPVEGSFLLMVYNGGWGGDTLLLQANDLVSTDPNSSVADLLSSGGSLSFRYSGGDENTIAFTAP